MEELLIQLTNEAQTSGDVVSSPIEDGMHLLVYPHEQELVVAAGFQPDQAHRVNPETVLRARGVAPHRYGAWLPALLADGSWYVVRRVPMPSGNEPALSEDELMKALELLS